jgi:hypothetical protein
MSNTEIVKPLNLARGIFYIVEFSAKGGICYKKIGEETKEVHEDESMTAEYSTRKEVDHIGLQTWSRKIVNAAYNVMERHCSITPVGYWISESLAPKMLEELAQVKMEARKLNDFARTVKSARRALIEVYAMQVGQEALEATAIRLAETVRDRLESLRTDLANGDLNAYATSWKRAKNLPRLATGLQSEVIVQALEAAKTARADLAEKLRNRMLPEKAGSELNFDMIDSAIVLFTDSVNGQGSCVEDNSIAA